MGSSYHQLAVPRVSGPECNCKTCIPQHVQQGSLSGHLLPVPLAAGLELLIQVFSVLGISREG
jgi:hypothetical protein